MVSETKPKTSLKKTQVQTVAVKSKKKVNEKTCRDKDISKVSASDLFGSEAEKLKRSLAVDSEMKEDSLTRSQTFFNVDQQLP